MLLASAINKLLMTHRFSIFTLASLLLLVCVGTSAKKRTFNEAKAIAQRQATSLGASLSSASIETAKRLNASPAKGESRAYYVFHMIREWDLPLSLETTCCPRSLAIPIVALMM